MMSAEDAKEVRLALGLNRRDFGLALGYKGKHVYSMVAAYENGARAPSLPYLFRVMSLAKEHGIEV